MKKLVIICLALSLIAFSTTAMAGTKAGMKEINLQMQYNDMSADDLDMSTWVFGGKLGYFFTDYFALGVGGALSSLEIEGVDITMYSIGLEPSLYLNMENNIVPYIGLNVGQVGFEVEDVDESELYYGGQIGMLIFLNEWAAIDIQGRYTTYEILDVDFDNFGFRMGLSVFFP